jgi:hypothetical protein
MNLKKFNKNSLIIYSLLLVGVIFISASLYIGIDVFNKVHHHQFPRRESNVELIQGWMTISHISHVYGVPEEEFINKLKIDPKYIKKTSIDDIARKNNINQIDFISQVKIIVKDFQETHKSPPKTAPHDPRTP